MINNEQFKYCDLMGGNTKQLHQADVRTFSWRGYFLLGVARSTPIAAVYLSTSLGYRTGCIVTIGTAKYVLQAETSGESIGALWQYPVLSSSQPVAIIIIMPDTHFNRVAASIHCCTFPQGFGIGVLRLALLLMTADQDLCDKVDDSGCWLIEIEFGKQMTNVLHRAARFLGNETKHPWFGGSSVTWRVPSSMVGFPC